MCGRFSLTTPEDVIAKFFNLVARSRLEPRYNIAPTQKAAVIRQSPSAEGGERKLDLLRWGLIPSWARDPAIGNRLINARSETAAEKPAFRAAMKKRRCLIPADGFYEWKKIPGSTTRQPFFIHHARGDLLALAGLWEHWDDPADGAIESFTILTTTPNASIGELHDRMPVIIGAKDFGAWLDPDHEDADSLGRLLKPAPVSMLKHHPVSTRVNSPKNDDASLIKPLESENLFGE